MTAGHHAVPLAIGCVGLGAMGGAMAARLLAAGHIVRGYDPAPAAMARWTELGGIAAPHAAAAAEGAAILVLMVHNAQQAREALFGAHGAAATLAQDAVVWLASTVTAEDARAIGAQVSASGLQFLDAPVSGGVTSARAGTLTVIAGGEPHALQAAQPAFHACASTVYHVGPVGAGSTVKMINNLLAASHVALTAEALALAQHAGVAADQLIEVVSHSSGQSRMFDKRAPRMAAGDHEPQVTVATFLKDLDIAHGAAQALGCRIPLASAARAAFAQAAERGWAHDSDTRLLALYAPADTDTSSTTTP